MHVAPSFLDRHAAREASALAQALRSGTLPRRQARLVRMALRYYVAEWDIIPDLVPGIGMLDDWLVLWALARAFRLSGTGAAPVDVDGIRREVIDALRGDSEQRAAE